MGDWLGFGSYQPSDEEIALALYDVLVGRAAEADPDVLDYLSTLDQDTLYYQYIQPLFDDPQERRQLYHDMILYPV